MIDYKALAGRANECLQQWEALEAWDISIEPWSFLEVLRTVVTLLNGMAQEKPALWMQSDHVDIARRSPFMARCAPTQLHPDYVPVYTHPAPQPQPGPTPEQEAALDRMAENARELGLDYEPMPKFARQPVSDRWASVEPGLAAAAKKVLAEHHETLVALHGEPVSEPITLRIVPSENDEEATALARESAERGRAVVGSLIVRNLRELAPQMGHYGAHAAGVLMEQAADAIDRLRATVQHEADCVETYRAQCETLIRERDEARAERASMLQAITDPENQPSQYGTVTLAMHEKVKAGRDALAKDAAYWRGIAEGEAH